TGTTPNPRCADSDNLSYSGDPRARVSTVKEITISSTAPATSALPTKTRIVVARPRAQPSVNGVSPSTAGSRWVISPISRPVKITDVIAGGIAPSRNIRGRCTIRLMPLVNNPAPASNSATADRGFSVRLAEATAQLLCLCPYGSALGLCRLAKLILEIKHLLPQARIADRQDAYRQQAGVASVADGDGCHRHTSGHLHDRQQGVHAIQILQRNRHSDHRQRSHRCQHAG